ncbi:MAG: amino acid permease [Bacteroidales bacterium]|nr:amino acid permease [Bacteroidales bacterium]
MDTTTGNKPLPSFTSISSLAVVVGIVVGIGIFRLPPIVAGHSANEAQFVSFWVAGGLISLIGALCYAELASSKPDAGGEYYFLSQAYGPPLGFLLSWGRMTVIQTGSIALIAFVLGDYASLIVDLGEYSSSIYAAFIVILLTGLNLSGTKHSGKSQMGFTSAIVVVLVFIAVAGLVNGSPAEMLEVSSGGGGISLFTKGAAGSAMIFVLLTYGGWNEAAYLSGELINVKRNIIKILVVGITLITGLYVLVNLAYLQVLGLEKLQNTEAVGAAITGEIFGSAGSLVVSLIVILAALSTANATIITGARTNYALGRDFRLFGFMGRWDTRRNTPANALIIQGIIALLLVGLGAWSKESVSTMVDYTAPIFWFFLLLTTFTLFVFRRRHNFGHIPYKVPLYPVTPILFLVVCLYMFYSSLAFTGIGALVGSFFMIAGIPVYFWARRRNMVVKTGLYQEVGRD